MNAVTRLDRADLEAVLSRYDVGELVDFWPAAHGIENSNYFVRTSREGVPREWVLTVLEQAPNAGDVFAPLLDLCFDAGLPVAPVQRNAAGSLQDNSRGQAPPADAKAARQPSRPAHRHPGRGAGRRHRETASGHSKSRLRDARSSPR